MRSASSGRAGSAPRDSRGARHPVTVMAEQMTDVFLDLGYRVAEGPEVEAEWFSFDALNMDDRHPSRAPERTFYVEHPSAPGRRSGLVLRTHTSPVQVRAMLGTPPPLRVVCTGRAYRPDPADATHSPVFHQVEGLAVDLGLTMVDLKKTLDHFATSVFGSGTATRLRTHRSAYTDPSAEVDVECAVCRGTGAEDRAAVPREGAAGDAPADPCGTCGGEGWIEWGGCGMVHPRVLAACGVDPHRYGAFAFGMGVERTLMLRHGLKDMRDVVDGDVRFPLGMDEFAPGRPRPRPLPRATPPTRAVPAARAVPDMETIPLARGHGARAARRREAGGGLTRSQNLRRRIGHALAGAGYVETPCFPFVCDAAWDAFGLAPDDPRRAALTLTNPISPREPSLRTTLLPGLLAALGLNLTRGNPAPALFEQGTVFVPPASGGLPPVPRADRRPTDDQLDALNTAIPAQPRHLAAALTGESSWARAVDAARTAAHIMGAGLVTRPTEYAPWLPGRCLELLVGGAVLGHAGELRAGTVQALGLPPRTSAMEIDLTAMEHLTDLGSR
ncbi:tRNA ligase subunit PheS family protein [Streptosporangium sp. OZ121]|uniref:tRNA ligase subunit PheS family protein n=1 Tax=Streptosporangium sp. OZ121 TaxID=3444183 RepID=UPI003F79FEF7